MNVDILIPNLQLSAAALAALPISATTPPAALAALLGKARKTEAIATAPGSFPWLLSALKVPEDAVNSAVSSLFSNAEIAAKRLAPPAANHVWLVAEPVYLKPDRDALALFRGTHLEISSDEATALIATLNQHFAQDGLKFAAATPARWYVQCPVNTAPSASSPSWIAARGELFTHMPVSAAGALNWRSILNEVQMLLFNHPVNEKREAAALTPINGVWVFGGDAAPFQEKLAHFQAGYKHVYKRVYSNNFEAQALAHFHNLKYSATLHNWESTQFSENCVVTIDALEAIAVEQDFSRWKHTRDALDLSVFTPLLEKLTRGEISCLRLIDAYTVNTTIYTIAPFSFKGFLKQLFSSKPSP